MRHLWKLVLLLSILGLMTMATAPAHALELFDSGSPHDNPTETNLFEVYNTLAGTSHTSNSDLGSFLLEDDDTISGDVIVLIATSGRSTNDVGYYTDLGTGNVATTLFSGVTGEAMLGPDYDAELLPDLPVGLFLSTSDGNTWHSEAAIDAGNTAFDHMVSYLFEGVLILETDMGAIELENARLIGWEDLGGPMPPDADYNDLMVVTGSTVAAPEPSSALLATVGLTVLAAFHGRGGSRLRRR
jgi:hypothetical protein